MRDADRPGFIELITDALAFYGQEATKFTLSVWWQACSPFDLEQVRKALTAHAMDPQNGRFAPKPADLVLQLQGTQTDRSLVAWGDVLDAMQRIGQYESIVFADLAIHAAITDMGGWAALCTAPVKDMPFTQKRFTDLHRTYSKRPDLCTVLYLVGVSELDNRAAGFPVSSPVRVGRAPVLALDATKREALPAE